MKLLVTGISGFVGGHFAQFILDNNKDIELHGISRTRPNWNFVSNRSLLIKKLNFYQLDLLNMNNTSKIIKEIKPDYILHLASFSSVAKSWDKPVESFLNNTNIFLNIVETIRLNNLDCRILSVGSSEEYGYVAAESVPIHEDSRIMPTSPYAVARVAQEHLSILYSKGYNLNICCTRSFNHIGPGQSDSYVVSYLVRQFVEIKKGIKPPIIKIHNGNIIRDFVDIQDVIRAYKIILSNGKSGEIYNVCSGKGYKILDIINILSNMLDMDVEVVQDKSAMRPLDSPIIVGSIDKMKAELGWEPRVPFEIGLKKIYDYWYRQIAE
jgi:GDP-4-dehydro-6-deoxy-D-mannose reductase